MRLHSCSLTSPSLLLPPPSQDHCKEALRLDPDCGPAATLLRAVKRSEALKVGWGEWTMGGGRGMYRPVRYGAGRRRRRRCDLWCAPGDLFSPPLLRRRATRRSRRGAPQRPSPPTRSASRWTPGDDGGGEGRLAPKLFPALPATVAPVTSPHFLLPACRQGRVRGSECKAVCEPRRCAPQVRAGSAVREREGRFTCLPLLTG